MMLFLCIPNSFFTPEFLIAKQKWCELICSMYIKNTSFYVDEAH